MNRAVAAKLDNPHMSLYDALVTGGFNYPRNVDAATMDNDRVTLGQRKNQLNRRLRMARNSKQKTDKKQQSKSQEEPGSPSSNNESAVRSGTSPLVIANSYLRQRRGKAASKPVTAKRVAPIQVERQQSKKQRLEDTPSSAPVGRVAAPQLSKAQLSKAKGITLSTVMAPSMQVKRGSVSPVGDDVPSFSAPEQENWWPAANSLLNAPGGDMRVQQQVNLVVNDIGMEQNQDPSLSHQSKRVVSTDSFRCAASQQEQQQQSEDSSTYNQVQGSVVTASVGDEDVNSRKEELGLLFFQAGLQDLYQKSMTAAGYAPEEATQTAPTFRKFAFQAWKGECERLQVLLKDHVVQPGQTGP